MDTKKEYSGAKHNLAKSLQNESAEHRAKVLEFVLDWNINPNEEFFLIFAAIGHLKILIEQAPEDIRQLFKSVLQELDEWSQITTEKLQIDSQHIKVTESLAQSSLALGTALNSLDVTSTQQRRAIEELTRTLEAFESRRRKRSQHELAVGETESIPRTEEVSQNRIEGRAIDSVKDADIAGPKRNRTSRDKNTYNPNDDNGGGEEDTTEDREFGGKSAGVDVPDIQSSKEETKSNGTVRHRSGGLEL